MFGSGEDDQYYSLKQANYFVDELASIDFKMSLGELVSNSPFSDFPFIEFGKR